MYLKTSKLFVPISTALFAMLFVDFVAFSFWTLSEQTPVDGFYIGAATAKMVAIIQ
jgi:hypothetical protein